MFEYPLSRRRLLRLGGGALTAAAVAGLAGCGERQAGTGGARRDVRMTWWGGETRTKAYQDAIAAYGRQHSEVNVITTSSGYDEYFGALDAGIAGGTAADLLQMDTALVSEYAERGVLLSLDGYVGDRLNLDGFPDVLRIAGKVDGKQYGVPSGTGAVLVTYDATVLKQVGVDPPPADWTWDGLKTYATGLTKKLRGAYGVSDGGGDDEGAYQIFLRQRRKDLFTADGALGYDREDLREWLTYWEDMRKAKAAAPGAVTSAAHNDASKNPLIGGLVAMAIGSGLEISLPPLTTHELDFVPLPSGPPGSVSGQYLSGGVLLCVFSRSEVAADAVDIIDFFANDEEAIKTMELTRGIPPTERARQLVAADLSPSRRRAIDATEAIAKQVAAAGAMPPPAPPKGAGEVKELLFQNNLAVAFGRKSVAAAVDSFFAGAESALG